MIKLIVFATVCVYFISCQTNHTYLIKKDFSKKCSGHHFTIYDSKGKTRQYQMETKFTFLHEVHVHAVPSEKLLGRLKAQWPFSKYKGTISLRGFDTDQWINGTIEQVNKFVANKFIIVWNGQKMTMEGKTSLSENQFEEESTGTVLAKFYESASSSIWKLAYDLQILTKDYPHTLLFLVLAIRDKSGPKVYRG